MVPNSVGERAETHPNALGKHWGSYLYISIQKRPVYADKLRASSTVSHNIGVKWGRIFFQWLELGYEKFPHSTTRTLYQNLTFHLGSSQVVTASDRALDDPESHSY